MRRYFPIIVIMAQVSLLIAALTFQNSRVEQLYQAASVAGVDSTTSQSPFDSNPISLPGQIEAEKYDRGGNNIAYFDKTPGNSGGAFREDDVDIKLNGGTNIVGWFLNDEWLEYTTTVSRAGKYQLSARLGSIYQGRSIRVFANGSLLTTISAPVIPTWVSPLGVTQPVIVNLPAGTVTIKIQAVQDNVDVDYIGFANTSSTCAGNYDDKSETDGLGQEIAVSIADLQVFSTYYRDNLGQNCNYDLIGGDCLLDLKDLNQFVRMYRQPNCGGL